MTEIVRCASEVGQRKPRIASVNPGSKISLVDTKCHFVRCDGFFKLAHQIKIDTSPFIGSRVII